MQTPEQVKATTAAFDRVLGSSGETVGRLKVVEPGPKIRLVPFDQIKLSIHRRDLIRGIIPRTGLTVVWGPPKCGKSFWVFDALMHVALGWEYRGHRVHQGPVVYCSFEGQTGVEARVEAYRISRLDNHTEAVPFLLQPMTLNLVRDHPALIMAVREHLGEEPPAAIVLDTLNRSMQGSESRLATPRRRNDEA